MVHLKTPKAGGPYTLTIKGKTTMVINDVLSGDVWLCTGQSNMAWPVEKTTDAESAIKTANFPQIRKFSNRIMPVMEVPEDLDSRSEWVACSPETAGKFSGTAFFTTRELHQALQVPIGIIMAASGGTLIESYISDEFLEEDVMANRMIEKAKAKAATSDIKARVDKNYPGVLYRGNIAPLKSYAIKGVVWYQGESNAFEFQRADYYRVQLPNLIRSFRKQWNNPKLPVYFVQLPNFKEPADDPNAKTSGWPLIRESFLEVANSVPDCGMIVTIDLGETKNIHPSNKTDVGKRMASLILNKTYGKNTPTSPRFIKSETMGDQVIVHFDYVGSGLMAKGDALEYFAIAGEDKTFVWADAVIEKRNGKDVVVVSSPQIKNPASVRYAWAMNPNTCNLYSKEGFPASPFRTDEWELYTRKK
ncbi:MAG: sialate O-acetylesterase [Gammaproteobacteria bacterium]|nr:sialate O-acetylesterase [Gammaproteobacteria bacterium]